MTEFTQLIFNFVRGSIFQLNFFPVSLSVTQHNKSKTIPVFHLPLPQTFFITFFQDYPTAERKYHSNSNLYNEFPSVRGEDGNLIRGILGAQYYNKLKGQTFQHAKSVLYSRLKLSNGPNICPSKELGGEGTHVLANKGIYMRIIRAVEGPFIPLRIRSYLTHEIQPRYNYTILHQSITMRNTYT